MFVMRIRCCSVLIVGALAAAPVAAQAPDPTVGRILASPKFTQATAFIQSDQDRFVRELIALTEIPSSPFKEQARAKAFLEMLRQHGLTDVEMDAEGNVMGVRKGTGSAGMIEVNAHLDTVFPEGTDVKVKRTFKGPGGHSYGAFGLVNPAFAMGGAIAKFSRLQVPASPKTTFNIGVVSGGTSINSIPSEVRMDVDLRSESCGELKKVDETFLALVREAVDDENRARSTKEGRIEADPKVIGERPCGETPMDAPLVQAVSAARTSR